MAGLFRTSSGFLCPDSDGRGSAPQDTAIGTGPEIPEPGPPPQGGAALYLFSRTGRPDEHDLHGGRFSLTPGPGRPVADSNPDVTALINDAAKQEALGIVMRELAQHWR